MSKIDISKAASLQGSSYPPPFDKECRGRTSHRLGLAAGLTQFGVNLVRLAPGAWSSQRHWHSHEDEFVYVIEGEVVMVSDEGDTPMRAGDCAGFKGGVKNGHTFQNRSSRDAVILAVGTRDDADGGEYPDIDLVFKPGRYSGQGGYAHKDGRPYTKP